MSSTTPAGSAAEEEPSATAATTAAKTGGEDENLPLGFLLKWETPTANVPQVSASSISTNGGTSFGKGADAGSSPGLVADQQAEHEPNGVSSNTAEVGAPTQNGDRESRVLYGSGERRRGNGRGQGHDKGGGKQSAMDRATSANSPAALSSPTYLWLSPREIELAGGTVVRALTMVDKTAYADVQYHWKLGERKKRVFFVIIWSAASVVSLWGARILLCFLLAFF